jgi:hypothetical protein
MDSTTDPEIDRKYRVIDQTLSMHCRRRDIFKWRALCLNTTLLAASIALNGFVFASDDLLAFVNIQPVHQRFWLGLSSITLLILSIVELRVNFEGTARDHARAAEKLATLKHQFRAARKQPLDALALKSLDDAYGRAFDDLPPIPDAEFVKLKAHHLRKMALSELLTNNPTAPVWVLRLKILLSGTYRAIWNK